MASSHAQPLSRSGSYEVGVSSSQVGEDVHAVPRNMSRSHFAWFDQTIKALRSVQRPSSAPPVSQGIEAWTEAGTQLHAMPTLEPTARAVEHAMQREQEADCVDVRASVSQPMINQHST